MLKRLEHPDIYNDRIGAFYVKDAQFNPTGRQSAWSGVWPWVVAALAAGSGMIGGLLRVAARRDGKNMFVAGALSSTPEKAQAAAAEVEIAPDRSHSDYVELAKREGRPRKNSRPMLGGHFGLRSMHYKPKLYYSNYTKPKGHFEWLLRLNRKID